MLNTITTLYQTAIYSNYAILGKIIKGWSVSKYEETKAIV